MFSFSSSAPTSASVHVSERSIVSHAVFIFKPNLISMNTGGGATSQIFNIIHY